MEARYRFSTTFCIRSGAESISSRVTVKPF